MIKPRSFNVVEIDEKNNMVIKRPSDKNDSKAAKKIYNEYLWLHSVASRNALVFSVPERCCWDSENKALCMSKVDAETLAEIYVNNPKKFDTGGYFYGAFARLTSMKKEFENFAKIARFSDVAKKKLFDEACDELYVKKTESRCQYLLANKEAIERTIFSINGQAFNLPIDDMVSFMSKRMMQLFDGVQFLSIMHGDFCLSNIFSNFVMIDPRGGYGDKATIFGDARYDVAKLRHSVVGLYDYVKAGKFGVECLDRRCNTVVKLTLQLPEGYDDIAAEFDETVKTSGYELSDIKFIEALLFLTMVPLHRDEPAHQTALFVIGAAKMMECMLESLKANIPENDCKGLRICFDLDGVICYVKDNHAGYEDCKPNLSMINLMRELSEMGCTIIIHTARGMGSSGNNLGAASAKVAKVTLDWLHANEVPYDEIYFGKPNAHITIDDRCLRYSEGTTLTKEEILCKVRLK